MGAGFWSGRMNHYSSWNGYGTNPGNKNFGLRKKQLTEDLKGVTTRCPFCTKEFKGNSVKKHILLCEKRDNRMVEFRYCPVCLKYRCEMNDEKGIEDHNAWHINEESRRNHTTAKKKKEIHKLCESCLRCDDGKCFLTGKVMNITNYCNQYSEGKSIKH